MAFERYGGGRNPATLTINSSGTARLSQRALGMLSIGHLPTRIDCYWDEERSLLGIRAAWGGLLKLSVKGRFSARNLLRFIGREGVSGNYPVELVGNMLVAHIPIPAPGVAEVAELKERAGV